MGLRASVIISWLFQVIMHAKWVLAILEQNWYKQFGNYNKKIENLLSSVYRPYDCITAPFYFSGGTKKAAKCTEMKHARAKWSQLYRRGCSLILQPTDWYNQRKVIRRMRNAMFSSQGKKWIGTKRNWSIFFPRVHWLRKTRFFDLSAFLVRACTFLFHCHYQVSRDFHCLHNGKLRAVHASTKAKLTRWVCLCFLFPWLPVR